MIFDTDVIIAAQRGFQSAAEFINHVADRKASIATYMEFVQSAQNKAQFMLSKNFFKMLNFETLPITSEISNRASMFIEEYSLTHGLRIIDALIAATAFEYGLPLATANYKDYKMIKGLDLVKFHARRH